jgi:hypothetical protein
LVLGQTLQREHTVLVVEQIKLLPLVEQKQLAVYTRFTHSLRLEHLQFRQPPVEQLLTFCVLRAAVVVAVMLVLVM